MQDFIYNQFQENKQLFKPYVSWPEVVHLGLNNVDAISNTFLKNIKLSSGERLLWVCYHKATFSFGSHNPNDGIACGCIITDHRIYYRNITKPKEFEIEWVNVLAITHNSHVFKIKTSRDEYTLPEEALLGRQVKKDDSVVSFFTQNVIVDNKAVTKEKLTKDFDSFSRICDKYYAFFESITNYINGIYDEEDDDGRITCANYLNESRFGDDEKRVLSVFNPNDIDNQTFVFGSVLYHPWRDTDYNMVNAMLITTKCIFLRQYVTDDEKHDFEYYFYTDWVDIASVRLKYDEELGSSAYTFFDVDGDESFYIDSFWLGELNEDEKNLKTWLRFFQDMVGYYSKENSSNQICHQTGEQSTRKNDVEKVDATVKTIDKPKTRRSFL